MKLSGSDSRKKVNTGQVVKAIILNGLGFVARPLYLFSQFLKIKDRTFIGEELSLRIK